MISTMQRKRLQYFKQSLEVTLTEIVKEHLKPQLIIIAERYKFYCRGRNENETISDYIAMLRKLTLNCNFRKFLDEELRDRFVRGLINGSIHR